MGGGGEGAGDRYWLRVTYLSGPCWFKFRVHVMICIGSVVSVPLCVCVCIREIEIIKLTLTFAVYLLHWLLQSLRMTV